MCPILEAPHPGRQPKQGLYKKIIYSSVNRGHKVVFSSVIIDEGVCVSCS
jgi:hypothetical protein